MVIVPPPVLGTGVPLMGGALAVAVFAGEILVETFVTWMEAVGAAAPPVILVVMLPGLPGVGDGTWA